MLNNRYWEVEYDDGSITTENDISWKKVIKNKIKRLSLIFDNRRWDLIDKQAYFVKHVCSASPGSDNIVVEKRIIGFYEGATKIHYCVDEFTGRFYIYTE